jgi:hypothetical protein
MILIKIVILKIVILFTTMIMALVMTNGDK